MNINRRTLACIVAFAAVVQIVVILYNNSTGYVPLSGVIEFLTRVTIGTLFSSPVAIAIVFADAFVIRRVERSLHWEEHFFLRAALETALALAIGVVLGGVLTVIVGAIVPYPDGLTKNVLNNALITAVVNLIILTSIEAIVAFRRANEAQAKAETLERENAEMKFQTLKTQLNPHFLFNSLNVLASLIRRDGKRAQQFIDEFSSVYRYTLDVIEQPVVELERELQFARSYLYLLQIRVENAVTVEFNVASDKLDTLVPPLSIQTVLENAFKHNKASEESPLKIMIATQGDALLVRNNLQPKPKRSESKGVGLENLRKRYSLLGEAEPTFAVLDGEFVASLPLITAQ